jgi:Winged helix domain, variant/ATPase family associated with various cellular activities (AAA)
MRATASERLDAGLRQLYVDDTEVSERLAELGGEIDRLDQARLQRLIDDFGLNDFEADVLVACVLADLDSGCGRIYAYLQDDLSRQYPSVGLLQHLFAHERGDGSARASFHYSAPLLRHDLVRVWGPGDGSLSAMAVTADDRIVSYLLGLDGLDKHLAPWTEIEVAPVPRMLTRRQFGAVHQLTVLGARAAALVGPAHGGKRQAARLFAHILDASLMTVDVRALLASPAGTPAEAVRRVIREAVLQSAVVYWVAADRFWEDGERALGGRRSLESELAAAPVVVLLGARSGWEPPPMFAGAPLRILELPAPDETERQEAWQGALLDAGVDAGQLAPDIAHVAAAFRLTVPQIVDAVAVAVAVAGADPGTPASGPALRAGARAVSARNLTAVSTEVVPRASWEQLVLHQDSVDQLKELCSAVRHHSFILERTGFHQCLSGGTGITALFAGVSGTGKTMAAEVVAGELGLPLFRIDLAAVVSKWIGETEKNLDRVFEAASYSNAILFFDEADAIFGKRSEVKDAHDRYANLEISYLLQKMESYQGVAILATNMRHQLDDAFLRRITFMIMFPMPEVPERARIWEAVWPPELPRSEDVDFLGLAQVKLTGGNIKNVVLAAAHLAVAQGRPVCTADLLHAIRREYQKLGKQMDPAQVAALLD